MKQVTFFAIFISLFFSKSFAQNGNQLFYNIFVSQKEYIDKLENPNDYLSIVNFAEKERSLLYNNCRLKLNNFLIIESFSLSSARFEGLLIYDEKIFSYYRNPKSKKIKLLKGIKTNIPYFIVELLKKWDIEKIGLINKQIGVKILDGSNILATKVEWNKTLNSYSFQHIAFEEFAKP